MDRRRKQLIASIYRVVARESIARVTIRGIAREAGVSAGLLHHYFGNKENLLNEMFDWLGGHMLRQPAPDMREQSRSTAPERMLLLVRQEIGRAVKDREAVQLFFDFWVQGSINPAIRERVSELLHQYRQRFVAIARDMVVEDAARFSESSAEGLAGMAASFVQGCAVQVMADPESFDIEEHLATAKALLYPSVASKVEAA